MSFIKKLRKNKIVVLIVCVIVVSLAYTGLQKAIDEYNFKSNNGIIADLESSEAGEDINTENSVGTGNDEKTNNQRNEEFENFARGDGNGEFPDEEIDFVTEEEVDELRG